VLQVGAPAFVRQADVGVGFVGGAYLGAAWALDAGPLYRGDGARREGQRATLAPAFAVSERGTPLLGLTGRF